MKTLWQIFSSPLRWAWRLLTFVRELTFNLIFILLLLLAIGIYAQLNGLAPSDKPQDGALLVDLSGTLVDDSQDDNQLRELGNELLGNSDRRQMETPLFKTVDLIRQAQNDNAISGIILSLKDFVSADQPALEYVGKALSEFRNSGKPIYAIGDSYSQRQYYLASFANEIYLTSLGAVDLSGFATNNLYYKSMLDKLKVNTHVYRVGTYKSAVEPFLRDNMSAEAREDSSRWVNLMWGNYLNTIAENRHLKPEQMFPDTETIVNRYRQLAGDSAAYALKYKLVDGVVPRTEIESIMMKKFGSRNKTFKHVSIYDYQKLEQYQSDNQIGIISVNGAITEGPQSTGVVGADTIAAQLHKARFDNKVKVVILRVNSPGGSVSGSELIRSEVAALRKAGKPVVVSMGGLAASGGYWVSTPADYIIASPNTLTGSIGIFGIIPTFENSLDAIGVYTDGVSTSPLAEMTITKNIPAELSELIQLQIENGYQTFINLVAKARNKTAAQVDKIAQGRVWIGVDALQNGLVDELGDFDDALVKALELAKLDENDYQLYWYSQELSWAERLFSQVNMSVRAMVPEAIKAALPAPYSQVAVDFAKQHNAFYSLDDPYGRYIYCLSCGYNN